MDEIDQLAALVKEIRAQTAKMVVVSARLDRVTAKLGGVIVKPVKAIDPSSPTATTSMVSHMDVHDAVPPSSVAASDVTELVTAGSVTNELVITSAGVADPLAQAPTIEKAPVVVPTILTDSTSWALATCSTECPSHDATEPTHILNPAAAPTSLMAVVDLIPVVVAAAASDRNLGREATGGIASTPTTCLMVGLPRHSMASPLVVAVLPPTTSEYVFDINNISVAAVPLATTGDFPTVLAPTTLAPVFQMQRLYNGSKFFMPTSLRRITSKVPRPMPWPCFMGVHVHGIEARPLPWPSFMTVNASEFPSDAVDKASRLCISDSSHAESCAAIEFQISIFCGNLFTSGYIITHDLCNFSEWRCLDDVLLFHWKVVSDYVQSAHTIHTPIVWLSCTIFGLHWLAMVRSLELKLVSVCSMLVTFSTVLVDSSNFGALTCECFGVYTTVCIESWLYAGCSLAVCHESSVQKSTNYFIGRECDVGILSTIAWLLELLCRSAITVCLSSGPTPEAHNQIASDSVSRLLSTMNCSLLKESVVLNSMNRPISSYDQLSCANQYTSYFPGYFLTGGQMDFVACSILNLFLSGFSPSCRSVVMFELQFDRSVSQCEYCSSISSSSDTSFESNELDLNNKVSYMAQQYTESYFGIQGGLQSGRALMQGISRCNEGSYRFNAIVVSYMGFLALSEPIHAGCTPSSIRDASYLKKIESCILAKELLLLQEGIRSWIHSENIPCTGHDLLAHGFVPMPILIEWLPSIHVKFITYELVYEDNESRCLLYWYHGGQSGHAMFLFLTFDRQGDLSRTEGCTDLHYPLPRP